MKTCSIIGSEIILFVEKINHLEEKSMKTFPSWGDRKKQEIALSLRELTIYGRPTDMPFLQEGEFVVAAFDRMIDENILECRNLSDMQEIYDAYARGMALGLNWYAATKKGGYRVITLDDDVTEHLESIGNVHLRQRISAVARENHGAIRVCEDLVKKFGPEVMDLLEEQGIVDYKIWTLYCDVCGDDLDKTHQMLVDKTAVAAVKASDGAS